VVFIEATPPLTSLREDKGGALAAFQQALNASVLAYVPASPEWDGHHHDKSTPFVTAVRGFFLLRDADMPSEAYEPYMAASNASTIQTVQLSIPMVGVLAEDFAGWLEARVSALRPADAPWTVKVTGVPAFVRPVTAAVEKDMVSMDVFVLPLAFAILGAMLRSWRLLLVPLVSIVLALALSFSLQTLVAQQLAVFTTVPSLMMSLTLAFSIDYALFLLVRYRMELEKTAAVTMGDSSDVRSAASASREAQRHGALPFGPAAVEKMLRYAGHTLVVSGGTLVLCFLGMLMIPFEAMQTLAIGCAIAILSTLLVNLSLTPALLLQFDSFFRKSADECHCGRGSRARRLPSASGTESDELLARARGASSASDVSAAYRGKRQAPCGLRAARAITAWPCNLFVALAVVGVAVPIALRTRGMALSDSVQLDMPRNLPQTEAYIRMVDAFGQGAASPCNIVLRPAPDARSAPGVNGLGPVINQTFFAQVQAQIARWGEELPFTSADDFQGLMHAGGFDPPADLVAQCMTPGSAFYPQPPCKAVRLNYDFMVAQGGTATVVTFTPRAFDPVTVQGREWQRAIRASIGDLQRRTGIEALLIGPAVGMNDVMDLVFNHFPAMVGLTAGICLLLLGAAFRSVALPLTSVLTVALTIAFVYGAAKAVYQDGALDFLGVAGLASEGMLSWLPPVCTLVILLGLTLDFTVFLLIHVVEARAEGRGTRDAIAVALHRTLWIITAAGVIMAVAFSGLLLSQIPVLNLFGAYLVFAVLVDTFVVRALLLPSVLSLLGDAIWWPAPHWAAGGGDGADVAPSDSSDSARRGQYGSKALRV